jgi:hypothetical protein
LRAHFGSYARPRLMAAYGGAESDFTRTTFPNIRYAIPTRRMLAQQFVQRGRQIANALAGCVKDRVDDLPRRLWEYNCCRFGLLAKALGKTQDERSKRPGCQPQRLIAD